MELLSTTGKEDIEDQEHNSGYVVDLRNVAETHDITKL